MPLFFRIYGESNIAVSAVDAILSCHGEGTERLGIISACFRVENHTRLRLQGEEELGGYYVIRTSGHEIGSIGYGSVARSILIDASVRRRWMRFYLVRITCIDDGLEIESQHAVLAHAAVVIYLYHEFSRTVHVSSLHGYGSTAIP